MPERWVEVNVLLIERETEEAFLLILEDPDIDRIWIPKSVVAEAEEHESGDTDCVLTVARWWAEKENLVDD